MGSDGDLTVIQRTTTILNLLPLSDIYCLIGLAEVCKWLHNACSLSWRTPDAALHIWFRAM